MFAHFIRVFSFTVMFFSWSAYAVDSMVVELGSGFDDDDGVDIGRVGVTWDWDRTWFNAGSWHVTGQWEAGIGYWDASPGTTGNDSVTEVSLTPVFRLVPRQLSKNGTPYIEGGAGIHLLSDDTIENKDIGTSLQFGPLIGLGVSFEHFEIGYRLRHLSNAGLDDNNPGVNFHMIRLGYRY